MRPIFISNPNSATVKKRGSVSARIAADYDAPNFVAKSVSDLPDIVKDVTRSEASWICIEGGDGTVHTTMTALMDTIQGFPWRPAITLLPGGMTNQVARQIGIMKSPEKRLRDILGGGEPEILPTPMLRISQDGIPSRHGFLFSTGAIPMGTAYYFDKLHTDGKVGAGAVAKMIAKGFVGPKSTREEIYHATDISLRMEDNGTAKDLSGSHLASIVTTLPGLMLGLDPFWGDGAGDLRLTYIRKDARKLISHLLSVWAGRKHVERKKDGFESYCADTLRYVYDGPVVMDGEPLQLADGPFKITATRPLSFWR